MNEEFIIPDWLVKVMRDEINLCYDNRREFEINHALTKEDENLLIGRSGILLELLERFK
jgi:hypothetical protein